MKLSNFMHEIRSIHCRKILNSHVEFTNEFVIELDNGSTGIGSSPKGETTSIYEDKTNNLVAKGIIQAIKRDQYLGVPLDQKRLDGYLQNKMKVFGKNNSYAISLAFFNASNKCQSGESSNDTIMHKESIFPKLCINVLNGGKYAYTNPVLSDFPEYILVSKTNDLIEIIEDHREIQNELRRRLSYKDKLLINNNLVNKFNTKDNRECIEFLLNLLQKLNLLHKYDLMIDASAGDLWTGDGYRFSLTDNSLKTGTELYSYWMNLIGEYDIKFLEDPFHEKDYENWRKLTTSQKQCKVISDNLYSSDIVRIHEGVSKNYTDGTLIKPNQAGTVSACIQAIKTAQSNDQIVITSHRSISTESTFLSELTINCQVQYIKIGPLCTDYSSIIRLNELIRLTEAKTD